jgi:16S rRNA (guanine1207-N2)-methyltransferase
VRVGKSAAASGLDPAVTVMIDCLDQVSAGAAPLVVGDPSGRLASALAATDAKPAAWLRRAGGHARATAWPPPGPHSSAFVRLPKAKDELAFLLGAAATTVKPGGAIVVFGANDEGIRSVGPLLERVTGAADTLSTRRHCRVIAGLRRTEIAGLNEGLESWRQVLSIDLGCGPRPWTTYPGLFARGGLDDGTRLLLAHLPAIAPDARVLDFASGTGVVAAAVVERQPTARVDLIDSDALAMEAARENVPGARLLLGTGLEAAAGARYAAILSNPPIHDGVSETHRVLERLIAEAPRYLGPGGVFQIVVQRRVKVQPLLAPVFGTVEILADDGRFRVWRAGTR